MSSGILVGMTQCVLHRNLLHMYAGLAWHHKQRNSTEHEGLQGALAASSSSISTYDVICYPQQAPKTAYPCAKVMQLRSAAATITHTPVPASAAVY